MVEVDARGRVSLAKYGLKNMNVVIDPLEGGGITIQPAVILTEAEAAHYANPEAVAQVENALESARTGKVGKLQRRSLSSA